MKKTIHHVWSQQQGFRTHKCKRCGCLKYWNEGWKKIVYERKGVFSLNLPICYLPNTKIN